MIIAERLEFNEISTDWVAFEEKVKELDETNPRIEIINILWPDDGISIEILDSKKFKISMTLNLLFKPNREYNLLVNNTKIILLLEQGFHMEKSLRFSQRTNTISVSYAKELDGSEQLLETLKALATQFHGFKLMVQMKDNATYVFTNDTLNHLFPYMEKNIAPKNELVNSIVLSLVEAYVEDRENGMSEVNCGKRTALSLVDELRKYENSRPESLRINWYPEKLYRILRKDKKIKKYEDISDELYEFIELVPYAGPGKRLDGSDCAVAYQIKKDNRYVSSKLKDMGVSLTIIFPGG